MEIKRSRPTSWAVFTFFLLWSFWTPVFSQFKVVGYLPSWSGSPADIQYTKLTHINYAFIRPTTTGGLTAVDQPAKLQDLVSRAHAAGVKVGIAIGGWSDLKNEDFQSMAGNATYRNNFVNNLVNLVNQYGLDGVDLDWEYPREGADPANFNTLMGQLSSTMHSRGKFLTAAVAASGYYADGIQSGVFSSVDFLNLMAYDGGGSNHSTYDFAVQTLNYWKGRGLPAAKAVLGVPFYGRSSTEYVAYNALLLRGASPNSDYFGNIGYNGIPTIKSKTNLAFDQAGGIMIWELSQDVNNPNSLLSAIGQVVDERTGNPPPSTCSGSGSTLPATLQAESYCQMSGIQIEATTDNGGGQNVGWIDAGDWMAYRINVATAGTYTVAYRVASQSGGGGIRLEALGGGTVFGTITVPSTGGWQIWTTIRHNVTLAAGQQSIAIAAPGGGFNINWFSLNPVNSPPPPGTAPIGRTIWLRGGPNDQYVSGENGATAMRCNRTAVGAWEQFTVVDAGGGKIALRSMSRYVSSENGAAPINCNRTSIGDWEKFDWVVNADGKISLRGNNGRYVSSENGTNAMTCNRTAIGGWESFTWGSATSARLASEQKTKPATTVPTQPIRKSENLVFQVFPNPSTGMATVQVSQPSFVQIISGTGKAVLKTTVQDRLVLEGLKPGIYLIQIGDKEKKTTRRLVVK
ncbi:MAG TPA: glycosyl hydrolase family 18 protein [Chryseosolibacter sp.]|nr:glycosyl hydrolase family 18 protein [Chryseosolibacter sp.]